MFGLFSSDKSDKKAVNPFDESITYSQGRLKVLEIQQIGSDPITRNRLSLFIKTLSVIDKQAYNTCVKTYGEGTVKRFIIADTLEPEEKRANVIETLIARGQLSVDDILLQLSELKDGFDIYNKNLDAC